jgi:ribonuclease HI
MEQIFTLRNSQNIQNRTHSPYKYLLQFDGGANPNPGPCAGAFVIYKLDPNGIGSSITMEKEILFEGGKYIEHGTNNVGEYMGLIEGLKVCKDYKFDHIIIKGDSKLVVYQVSNKWKVNYEHIRKFHLEIHDLLKNFSDVSIQHLYRTDNKKADQLSDETLEKRNNWIRF